MSEEYKPLSKEKFDEQDRINHVEGSIHLDALDAEYYEEALGIKLEDLKGEVLDIGGAPKGKFSQEASEKGIKLVTLNPNYHPGRPRGMNFFEYMFLLDNSGRNSSRVVAGLAQQLPFKNSQFDYEISVGSVPGYLPEYESEFRQAFQEMLRVLKPGGKILLFPIRQGLMDDPSFKDLMEDLKAECLIEFQSAEEFNHPGQERFFRMKLTKSEVIL